MERVTNINMKEFLKDWEVHSDIELLEEAQTKKDIISIAKAKGIDLKNNTDLAGFKCTYAFANKANRNGARLPKEALLKALPSMIGKPVNIDHQRRYVIGHYIDYSYNKKEDKVIGYGVIYKSNFDEEWEKAQKLFKAKKLTTSYEIWCPENKRRHLSDGTYELLEQAIAGGAILFKEKPAFKDAKVLELAMKRMEKEKDLVYASTEKDEELIIAEDNSNQIVQPIKIKCSHCNNEFTSYPASEIKCPSCLAIVNKEGNMIYPPQKKDFRIMCPACKTSHWKILDRDKETAKIKCLNESVCGKSYLVHFAKDNKKSLLNELSFLYMTTVSCIQCGKSIEVIGTSNTTTKQIKCSKCGLEYSYDIKGEKTYKKISAIEEIAIETSEKGGTEMKDKKEEMKASEEIVEKSEKQEDKVQKDDSKEAKVNEKVEKATQEESEAKVEEPKAEKTETPKAEEKVKASFEYEVIDNEELDIIEVSKEEKAERLSYQQKKSLPDKSFAVVVNVKGKRGTRKVRMFPINDEAHVRNALARLGQPAPQATLKKLGVSVESVRRKILRRARQLKMTTLLERYKSGIKKLAKSYKDMRKQVQFYQANAVEVLKRRQELGDYKISDKDIMDNSKFEQAKAQLEQAKIEKENENTNEIIGIKEKASDYYSTKRKEIDDEAFGRTKSEE